MNKELDKELYPDYKYPEYITIVIIEEAKPYDK